MIFVFLDTARSWQSTKRKIEYVSSDDENPDDSDPVDADEEDDVIAMYKSKKSKLDKNADKNFKTVIDVTPLKEAEKSSTKPNVVYVSKYFKAKSKKIESKIKEEKINSDDEEETRVKDKVGKESKRQSKFYLVDIFIHSQKISLKSVFFTSYSF